MMFHFLRVFKVIEGKNYTNKCMVNKKNNVIPSLHIETHMMHKILMSVTTFFKKSYFLTLRTLLKFLCLTFYIN